MTRIDVGLFNIMDGCLRADGGGYAFRRLHQAAATLDRAPAVWLINEAKQWRANANAGLFGAAEALSDALRTPYVAVLGTGSRGPIPPAIIYDPTVLVLRAWYNPDDPDSYPDKLNVARFAVRDSAVTEHGRDEFLAVVEHFHPNSRAIRRQEAERLTRYGRKAGIPVIVGADTNGNASGPHLPQRDWTAADYERRRAEARLLPDGTWETDTDPLDHLIGRWDDTLQRRVDGCGYHAVAEIAWQAGADRALQPTVADKPGDGGPIIKDYLLANDDMAPHIDPHSYAVHGLDPDQHAWPSDHGLIVAALDLDTCYTAPPRQGDPR